jgi:transposase
LHKIQKSKNKVRKWGAPKNWKLKKIKGLYSINGIITLPREMWTLPGLTYLGSFDDKLENILKSLPLSYKVQVDPEDLL